MACTVGRVQDLVVKYGEIEGEAQADWVSRCQLGNGNFRRGGVGLKGLVGGFLATFTGGELGQVAVIIAFPGIFVDNLYPIKCHHHTCQASIEKLDIKFHISSSTKEI